MKTNAIIRIIIYSVIILLLLSILGALLAYSRYTVQTGKTAWTAPIVTPGHGEFHHEDHEITGTESITHIEIEWVAGNITIQPGDTTRILLSESGSFDTGEAMVCRRQGNKLIIEYQEQDVFIGIYSTPEKDLTVTVPMDWEGTCISIDSASAQLNISGISVREVELESASGKCVFDGCSIGELDIDTASGDVTYTGTLNTLEFDGASADLHAVFHNVPKSLDMDSASGDMDITLPDGCGFTAAVDAMSGDFSSDFDCIHKKDRYVCGDGSCRIDLSTMSGDMTIRKGK